MSKTQPRSRAWYRSFHLDRDRTALQSRSDELSITILLVTCKARPGPVGLPGSRSSRDRGHPCPCTSMKKTPNSLHSFDRGEQLGSERHRPHGGIVGGRRRGRVPRLRAGLGDDRRAPFTEWRLPGRGLPLVTGEGPASPLSSPAGFKPASAPIGLARGWWTVHHSGRGLQQIPSARTRWQSEFSGHGRMEVGGNRARDARDVKPATIPVLPSSPKALRSRCSTTGHST